MPRSSAKRRIREFLGGRVGEVVTGAQIQDAAGPSVTEWARRVRELRTDEGWDIRTHNDDGTLKPGEYRLASKPPSPGAYRVSRAISARVRTEVLARNGHTCQMCGAGAGDVGDDGRRVRLHIDHIVDRSHGGSDVPSNLRALCSECNQGAKNLMAEPPNWTRLLVQIRKSSVADQQAALEWLQRKFGEEGQ